jgi:hypothetical protein
MCLARLCSRILFSSSPAALLSSSTTTKAKRGKFGSRKGKSIDANEGFSYWKTKAAEEEKDEILDEETPATRKETTFFVLVAW